MTTEEKIRQLNEIAPDREGLTVPDATVEKAGCTDHLATNFDPEATIDNGTCTYLAGV